MDEAQLRAIQEAAAQGDAKAQFNLGYMYANGQGVRQDYAMARQWYEKAAAQGDAILSWHHVCQWSGHTTGLCNGPSVV